jgi:hypothetical protein
MNCPRCKLIRKTFCPDVISPILKRINYDEDTGLSRRNVRELFQRPV